MCQQPWMFYFLSTLIGWSVGSFITFLVGLFTTVRTFGGCPMKLSEWLAMEENYNQWLTRLRVENALEQIRNTHDSWVLDQMAEGVNDPETGDDNERD